VASSCNRTSADQAQVEDRSPSEPSTASTTDAPVEVDTERLQAMLEEYRVDNDIPGVQLGVRMPGLDDDIVLAAGIDDGVNGDPETPMPTDGTFAIASVTRRSRAQSCSSSSRRV
jgi:hypothetical protein